ncbi:MAG: DinB family protein [Bacteroidetes bacterium]|nr:MAG: DinB family protein [Bacteroidota bacterium]TAF90337.1 MAG: DinB family protein [Bacteroidota bacterium]
MPSTPIPGEYAPYFQKYIDLVDAQSSAELIIQHSQGLIQFYSSLPEAKADYAYAEGKWTVKEVLQHVIDTERIFSYRLLRVVRGDQTALPGFDENSYATHAQANARSLESLKDEFAVVRHSTDALLASLTPQQLQRTGNASNHVVSGTALAFMVFGHALHHKNILEERYL